jgi:hypothetical protein
MSYKNILQEYCLKNGFDIPIYLSDYKGQDHTPSWKSVVCVNNSVNFASDYCFPTKVKAEQFVAMNVYQYLQSKDIKEKNYINDNPNYIALIDIENIQAKIDYTKPVEYHIFLSEYSSVDKTEYKNCVIHTINSNSNESTDHLMTYEASRLFYTKPHIKNYIILSRDKSSGILCNLLERDGYNVLHFKNKRDFENFILTLN